MDLKSVFRAAKTNVAIGEWKTGHIPRDAFPMSLLADKRYKYGPDYHWRVVRFDALGEHFRVLLLVNEGKEIYRARLGMEVAGPKGSVDMLVLCDHEFHATEPGWHCHAKVGEVETLSPGAARSAACKWPKSASASKKEFGVSLKNALSLAAERYRFSAPGSLL